MQKTLFDKIVGFLLGALWAIVVFGALIIFKLSLFLGFILAFFITLVFVVVFLFVILLLDAFVINKQRLELLEEQNKILKDILKNNSN